MNVFEMLITTPLGYILSTIYDFVQNYGWAVIIFTLITKLIILPLSLKQQKSMSKMQAVRPLLEHVQEKYKDDPRVEVICGMNHLGVSDNVTADYFFSRQGSIWGTATWKRAHENRGDFSYGNDPYIMKLLKQRTRHNRIAFKRLSAYAKNTHFEGHTAGSEFWIEFNMYAQNSLQIVPKYNMINNVGFGDDTAHSTRLERMPKSIRKLYNMKTYEYKLPLKHPKQVIPDVEYEKQRNKIIYYNAPTRMFFQNIFGVIRALFCGDFSHVIAKLKKLPQKIRRTKGKEIEK